MIPQLALTICHNLTDLNARYKMQIEIRMSNGSTNAFAVSLHNVENDTLEVYYMNGCRALSCEETGINQTITAMLDTPNEVNRAPYYAVAVKDDQGVDFTIKDPTTSAVVPLVETSAINEVGTDAVFGKLSAKYATAFNNITVDPEARREEAYEIMKELAASNKEQSVSTVQSAFAPRITLLLLLVAAVVVMVIGGGAAIFFIKRRKK